MIKSDLINFNILDAESLFPFPKWPIENLLQSQFTQLGPFRRSICNVDTVLYNMYVEDDLRKSILYQSRPDGTQYFKGDFNVRESPLYNGYTVAEVYLISAESKVRNGKFEEGIDKLNDLLVTRWKEGTFNPIRSEKNENDLRVILTERRKELGFKGKRWQDIRRLNKDERFAITLTREVNGESFTLAPGERRYVFKIPKAAMEYGGYDQN